MAFPIVPLLALFAVALAGGGSRRGPAPAPAPGPTPAGAGPLPDGAFGPRVAQVPLQQTPNQLARAQAVQPQQQPQQPQQPNVLQQIINQGPIDRRTAAIQLQEYLRTHTGTRRQRNVVAHYQGLLGTTPDGLDGPNTQIAIRAAMEGPFQQPPQPYQFEPGPQQPQQPQQPEWAKQQPQQTPGGWEQFKGPASGAWEQGKGAQ